MTHLHDTESGPARTTPLAVEAGTRLLHHVGISVTDLDRAIGFWGGFLGVEPTFRGEVHGPHLAAITGHAVERLQVAWLPLAGSTVLELCRYESDEAADARTPGTARGGSVHLTLTTPDVDATWSRALACGGVKVSAAPVDIERGPAAGARVVYLRDPDGATIELIQPAPAG